ncbi:hypothetical protein E2C01_050674 [Portunus trituberculatus]|uniref:Uncharacterized protein n=1 Tax=Portunus trituberculatus TaxID=210409 RepID=A0A5B7GGS4_PORTR|nr:hypothetical protein [Portunus trituberculatus]
MRGDEKRRQLEPYVHRPPTHAQMSKTLPGPFLLRHRSSTRRHSVCHTAPMPGNQTPIQDIDGGVCYTAPMPGGQPLITSHGFIHGSGIGVCPSAPMPGGHPLPRCGFSHVDPGESVPCSLLLFQEASVEAGRPAPVPGGSGEGQDLLASMPVGHPLSTVGSYPKSLSYAEELDHHVTLDLVVQDMLAKEAIELVVGKLEGFYARLLLVPKVMNLNPSSPFLLLRSMLATRKGTGFYAEPESSGSTFIGPDIVVIDALAFL